MKKLVKDLTPGDVIPVPRHEMSWLGKDATMEIIESEFSHNDKRGPWVVAKVKYRSPYDVDRMCESRFYMRPETRVTVIQPPEPRMIRLTPERVAQLEAMSAPKTCDAFNPLVNDGNYRGTICCVCGENEAAHTLRTFKNERFTQRDYESTNIVACMADTAPSEQWTECAESILVGLTKLWIEKGVHYFGYL